MPEPLIEKHGGYRSLKSFQVAQLVYDVTVRFCDKFIDKRSRTHDQMVQAARSGVQNIAEGSQASGTSKKMEMKLTNVARASLEELRLDYEDFLRHREMSPWDRNDTRREALISLRPNDVKAVAQWARAVRAGQYASSTESTESTESTKAVLPNFAEITANAAIALLAVASALLDRQLAAQAKAFEKEGGFTERLYNQRSTNRRNPQ